MKHATRVHSWRTWAADRRAWLLLLLLFAVVHYAAYFRHGLNFRDEGGTVALIAQRLLAGERPFADVALGGYNVLWFWPVVALFKGVGVSFIALRVYCFALATITALLVFWIVERASRRPWLAFLVGALAVLVPGMTFKNYMPLVTVANMAGLLGTTLAAPNSRARRWRLAGGAIVLGITWLIRVDLGIFWSALWLGGSVLGCFPRGIRWRGLVAVPLFLAVTCLMVQLPFYWDAQRRGYADSFVNQYKLWPQLLLHELRLLAPSPPPARPAAIPAKAAPTPVLPAKAAANRDTLQRQSLGQIFSAPKPQQRLLALLIYLPLVSLVPLSLAAFIGWLRAWSSPDPEPARRALAALLALGGAFTVFPQYFFFRPDAPHLSEFSPGFWAAVAAAPFLLGWRGWCARVAVTFLALHAALFFWRMWPDRWAGTIWMRAGRTELFSAENGVRVYLSKREAAGLAALLATVRGHSRPEDYLVAYPYHPAINLLSNRRTFERDTYVDNTSSRPTWDAESIARLQKFRPAVIVISHWEINGTPDSRFDVWARGTVEWIRKNYDAQGEFSAGLDQFEVYTRPEPGA